MHRTRHVAGSVRILLPVVATGVALLTFATFTEGAEPTATATLATRAAGGILLTAVALAAICWVSPRRPRASFGVAFRRASLGFALWLVPAVLATATLGGPLRIDGTGSEVIAVTLLVLAAVLLSEAVPEELVFRGHVLGVLRERLGPWPAIVTQAVMFAAFALLLRGWTGVLDLSLFLGMGIGLGYLRVTSGSVWTAVGFHAGFQTGSQLVLTHGLLGDVGSDVAMLTLGTIPFAVGAVAMALLAERYPERFSDPAEAPHRGPGAPPGTPGTSAA